MCIYVCAWTNLCVSHVCRFLQMLEAGIEFPGLVLQALYSFILFVQSSDTYKKWFWKACRWIYVCLCLCMLYMFVCMMSGVWVLVYMHQCTFACREQNMIAGVLLFHILLYINRYAFSSNSELADSSDLAAHFVLRISWSSLLDPELQ